MKRERWQRAEKKMVGGSVILAALLGGGGGFYEWQNRVPELPNTDLVEPKNNGLSFVLAATKALVAPTGGAGTDLPLASMAPPPSLRLYSTQYDRLYPLCWKKAFLATNVQSLKLLRAGLARPYLQPADFVAQDLPFLASCRQVTRLYVIEAHFWGQQKQWDEAADSLMDGLALAYQVPRGGNLGASLTGDGMRQMLEKEFWPILPHLSASKARECARKLEVLSKNQWSLADTFRGEKRELQKQLMGLIRARDLRPLFVSYGCIGGCAVSKAQYQRDLNALPVFFKLRLAWMNKPRLVSEQSRCFEWNIANVSQPYPAQKQTDPFPQIGDGFDFIVYPEYPRSILRRHKTDARIAILTAALALHAFHQETGCNPAKLNELCPRFLGQIPRDPFTNALPLAYKTQGTKYISNVFVPPAVPGIVPAPPPFRFATTPYTLYSVGFDAKDNGGKPCSESSLPYHPDTVGSYYLSDRAHEKTGADFVAHINIGFLP